MAKIRCSLCNILPIQIKNLDDYLCEKNHVVCKKCLVLNAQKQLICSLCNSRIIKNRKILLESSDNNNNDLQSNTIFNQNINDDINNVYADDFRYWPQQCGILQSPIDSINNYNYDNSDNNCNDSMRYHMGDVPNDLYAINQNSKRCSADENMCFEKNMFLKNNIFDPNTDLIDDKDKFKININNSKTSQTDNDLNDNTMPYRKIVNGKIDSIFDPQKHFYRYRIEKNELNRKPSLGKKFPEKNNENNLKESESTLVLKRYAEYQEDPVYNAQKQIISPIITFTYNAIIEPNAEKGEKEESTSGTIVQTIYERPNLDNNKNNVTETLQSNQLDINNLTNINVTDGHENELRNKVNTQLSRRTMLRNQIREMTYSNIKDTDVESVRNGNFISQTSEFKPSPLISLHMDNDRINDKSTFYSGVIQQRLNRAMEDIFMNEQNSRNAKREKRQEIVRQEKEVLRKRIKDEIYKNVNDPITTIKNVASCDKSDKNINSSQSANQLYSKDLKESISSKINLENIYNNREFRNISLSTESYPKLNPQLHVVSQTLSNFDKKYSKLHEESFDEIKKQFEKQTKLELELIASIDSDIQVQEIESLSKNYNQKQSSSQHINNSKSQISNCHRNQSIIIDLKNSQNSEFCHNLNIVTSAEDMQTLHEAPENRKIKIKQSAISTQTITNDININNNNNISIKNPEITESNMNNTYCIKENCTQDNIIKCSQDTIQNIEKSLNNQIIEIEFDNQISINNNPLQNFIDVLKIKNPSMTNSDLHDIIKFLPPAATPSELNKVIDNIPINRNSSDISSEIIMKDIKIRGPHDNINDDDDDVSIVGSSSKIHSNNNAWRAFYCPPIDYCSEPRPQILSIKLDKNIIFNSESKLAGKLNIERHPVNCPITSCKRKVFISEFTKHMKVDHTKTFIESIEPGECRNLFLDPKVVHHGINKCHSLYLVTDKIRDLGSREYKNYLPIMLMSTKISLLELLCSTYRSKDDDVKNCKENFIVIWLTGLVVTDLPIYYTLIVWSNTGHIPKCHIVHSGTLYSFRDDQNAKTLFKKGQALLISKRNCDLLTDNGKNMIEIQVIIH